jgi:hypothetical protein
MIETYQQLRRWWEGLPRMDREAILSRMRAAAQDDRFRQFAESLSRQYAGGSSFSERQLAAIKKWADR